MRLNVLVMIVVLILSASMAGVVSAQEEPDATYITVDGTIQAPSEDPIADATVVAYRDPIGDPVTIQGVTHTDNDGEFEMRLLEGEFSQIVFYQANLTIEEGELEISQTEQNPFPKDGVVDVYALKEIYPTNYGGDDFETETVPKGYNTKIKAVDQHGQPVPGASARIVSRNEYENLDPNYGYLKSISANEDGVITPEGREDPGIELYQLVTYTVTPPESDAFADATAKSGTLDVLGPQETRSIEFTTERPNAAFTTSAEPTVGGEVRFNASGSTDTNGAIASYSWDFDDDGQSDANGETATHTFQESGTHDVTLTVTDADGFSATITQQVQVEPPETTTQLAVRLSNTTGGFQNADITLDTPTTITETTSPLSPDIYAGGTGEQSVSVRIADLNNQITTDDTDPMIFLVTLQGDVDPGEVSLTVTSATADTGKSLSATAFQIAPGALFTEPVVTDAAGPPQDPDSDGLYEDVNGDGEMTFEDAVTLAFVSGNNLSNQQISALDFDENGSLDFQDAVALAFSI
jgi:PKD repeat protein